MADKDQVLLQRVRFTGKRTGLASIVVDGYGRVSVGNVIEVTVDEAERYTAKRLMRDGKEAADFSKVGGEFSVDKSEVMDRRFAAQERMADDASDLLPDEVNTDMAHEVRSDTGTVEEYAEVMAMPPDVEPEAPVEPKKGQAKKE